MSENFVDENLENMPPNVLKPYDAKANIIAVSEARKKNITPIKSAIDRLSTNDIGKKITVTETLAPNPNIPFPSKSDTYTGILRSINPNYNGSLVSSIELEKSSGQTITIQNLRDSYNYRVEFLSKGGLKHSNSKKRKSFRRKHNKKSLKRRKSRCALKYKR